MRIAALFILLFIFTSVFATPQADANENFVSSSNEISALETLEAKQRLKIKEISLGCFHNDTTTINIVGDSASIDGVGSVVVTGSQLKRLDNYLEYVRQDGENGFCTTTDTFEISVWQDGDLVKSEQLIDGTCRALSRSEERWLWKDWWTPSQIAYSIEQKKTSYPDVR